VVIVGVAVAVAVVVSARGRLRTFGWGANVLSGSHVNWVAEGVGIEGSVREERSEDERERATSNRRVGSADWAATNEQGSATVRICGQM
jgi:hypothetical protein